MSAKTIRCTRCATEFSDAEIQGCQACPTCGSIDVPMSIAQDATVRINVHELRILAIWAENYAVSLDNKHLDDATHEPSAAVVKAICGRLHPQLAAQGIDSPLTLSEEIGQLRQEFPKMKLTVIRDGREEVDTSGVPDTAPPAPEG